MLGARGVVLGLASPTRLAGKMKKTSVFALTRFLKEAT